MKVASYYINLDRAVERREFMETQLSSFKLECARIPAVLGADLKLPINGFNATQFKIFTGKQPNPAEIGCYFSHLRLLEAFLKSDATHALALEDDALLPEDLHELIRIAVDYHKYWDLLRLSSSRRGEFMEIVPIEKNRKIAINKKVLKNTAAYLINRDAAEKCLVKLKPMKRPYDVALDRDWAMNFKTACIVPFPVQLSAHSGQIPRAARIKIYRLTTFHLFHLIDHIQRNLWRNKIYSSISKI